MEIKNIRVVKSKDNPESVEVLAKSIVDIADALNKLINSSLKEEAIVALLLGMPGMQGQITKSQILLVFKNLKRLKSWYIK